MQSSIEVNQIEFCRISERLSTAKYHVCCALSECVTIQQCVRCYLQKLSRAVKVAADHFTKNSEVLLPLRGKSANPVVYSCQADVVDVPRAFKFPKGKVSRISRGEITATSDHSWKVNFITPQGLLAPTY